MTALPSTLLKLLVALLKHRARAWLGEEAAGIAAHTLIDQELQTRLEAWLGQEQTARALLQAAERARLYLQDPRHCPDEDLRCLFHSLDFGDLPTVQQALADLPQALDASAVTEALRADFDRTLPNLSPEQRARGAQLWTDALLAAVGTLEPFTLPIIHKVVQENSKKLDSLGVGQAEIKALLEKLSPFILQHSSFQTPPSPTQPGDLPLGSYLPIQPNPFFTGREAELAQLAASLLSEDGGVIINQQALVGMGGLGKTQLAVQFAWKHGHRFAGVHWVSAYRREKTDASIGKIIEASIAHCGQEMGLQPWPGETDQQAALTISAWKQNGPRLVILDNLEDVDAAAEWLA